jgi:hypothetical protein
MFPPLRDSYDRNEFGDSKLKTSPLTSFVVTKQKHPNSFLASFALLQEYPAKDFEIA